MTGIVLLFSVFIDHSSGVRTQRADGAESSGHRDTLTGPVNHGIYNYRTNILHILQIQNGLRRTCIARVLLQLDLRSKVLTS